MVRNRNVFRMMVLGINLIGITFFFLTNDFQYNFIAVIYTFIYFVANDTFAKSKILKGDSYDALFLMTIHLFLYTYYTHDLLLDKITIVCVFALTSIIISIRKKKFMDR